MEISKSDIIIEYQTDTHYIPPEEKAYFGGIKGGDGIKSQMSSYIDGYREAINAIFDRFKTEADQGHTWVQDTIVFPLIFTHRHCVELELKRLFCLTDKKFEELSHSNTHLLCELWSKVKDFVIERALRLKENIDVNAIEHYIEEMDSYDVGSFRFRYPMDISLNSNNVILESINLVTFHKQMNLFHDTMEKVFFSLADQVDEWELDKVFRRQFLYCLKTYIIEIKNALCYEYPETQTTNKIWLSLSDISDISEEEKEREYKHCQAVLKDVKEAILILYYSLRSIKLNKIVPSNSEERRIDILKICNDNYCNENVFGKNTNNSFWEKFSDMVNKRDKIISLAEEIISLSK